MNLLDRSLGQLARDIPGITAVFHKYHLDFCCGGQQSLRSAAARRQVDLDQLQQELERLQNETSDAPAWSGMSDTQLIEFTRTRYHDIHRQQLPELMRLANRVEQVHGGRPECPIGLAQHLERMYAELENHMQKEEEVLFPIIARGFYTQAVHPSHIMRHEHEQHGEALAVIDQLTFDITLPDDACNTWRALYLGLETFKTDLINHIHLENNVLFDRFDSLHEEIFCD